MYCDVIKECLETSALQKQLSWSYSNSTCITKVNIEGAVAKRELITGKIVVKIELYMTNLLTQKSDYMFDSI